MEDHGGEIKETLALNNSASLAKRVLRNRRRLWLEKNALDKMGRELRPWLITTLAFLQNPSLLFSSCSQRSSPKDEAEDAKDESEERMEEFVGLYHKGSITHVQLCRLVQRDLFYSQKKTIGLDGLHVGKKVSETVYRELDIPSIVADLSEEENIGWAQESVIGELKGVFRNTIHRGGTVGSSETDRFSSPPAKRNEKVQNRDLCVSPVHREERIELAPKSQARKKLVFSKVASTKLASEESIGEESIEDLIGGMYGM